MMNRYDCFPEDMLRQWQSIIELIVRLAGVPVGLVMTVNNENIEVLISNGSPRNPYDPGMKEHLDSSGLYCEEVIATQQMLHVANARKSEKWWNNPDLKYNLISYLGFPIRFPDGQPFGTICVLDDKENEYSPDFIEIMEKMRILIEQELRNLENMRIQQQLKEKLRIITDSARDAILMMDSKGAISYWNPAAEQIFGYRADEALGVNLHNILAPDEFHADHYAAFAEFQHTGSGNAIGKTLELVAKRNDGQEIPVALSLSSAFLNNEWHAVGIIRDITELKQHQRNLELARETAEAANRAKSEFLANMSHEIRTPMNGVMGMAQLLRFTELTPEQQEYLNSIEISADNLLQIINDILDLTKIESGKIELEYADFSLRRAIEEVVTTQISRVYEKRLTLQKDIPFDLPEVLLGDQLRIKQMLLNLLGNAIKFTEQGSITIAVRLLEQDMHRVLIRLTVSDTGVGMPSEALQKIFKPFEQADTSTTRRFGGTGLGLTICRKLAELMGGAISVESTPGVGSSFHLEIPFELSAAAVQRQAQTATLPEKPARSLTILIAEDHPTNLRMLELLLRKIGHSAICTNNGKEAVERWRKGGVDLILMDIQMPVMNGVEALEAIRAEEQASGGHLSVIALTADALKGTKEKLLKAGFDGYLTKPVKTTDLTDELTRVTAA